ncbi:MAG: type III secretion inner membrane ring lipoprotein SctJ [Deltaproteobacteria bacterium]|nr:type III secretion inner membrane ring lipoprotein SctJ [Deltaproteobacteria bacterium]
MNGLRVLSAFVAVGLLVGCEVEILNDLDQQQANEILDVLGRSGIAAERKRVESGSRAAYTVSVSRGDASQAWALLRQQGLPRRRHAGLAEVFGKPGLVPTPTHEQAMLRRAIAGELSQTLQSIEGVHSARVHVVMPKKDRFQVDEKPRAPRAAVLISAQRNAAVDEAQVKRLVSGAVDGLTADAVNVVILRGQSAAPTPAAEGQGAQLASVGPFRVAVGSRAPLAATLLFAVLVIAALVFLSYLLVRRTRQLEASLAQTRRANEAALDGSLSLIAGSIGSRR